MGDKAIVLVTGGSGLVALGLQWAIARGPVEVQARCDEEWVFCGSRDGDLRNINEVEALFSRYAPQFVIHLAARTGGNQEHRKYPASIAHDNLLMDMNVLATATKFKVRKLIVCLSTCAFDSNGKLPMVEEDLHSGPPHQTNYAYASAKRMTEVLARAYTNQYGTKCAVVIPTNIFGPGDTYGPSAHVIPGLIRKAVSAKEAGTALQVAGTGNACRQFLYSRDLGRLLVMVLRHYDRSDPIILAGPPDDDISIRQLAEAIANATKFTGPIHFDSQQPEGPLKKTVDNRRLQMWLATLESQFRFTPFEQALQDSVQWYLQNRSRARL